jgi:phage tail sheath protein FI
VHKAPANEALDDAIALQFSLSDVQQRDLNVAGVNCLRALPGRGIRIWGGRTISADPSWRYVGVRRLFLTVGRWAERHLAALIYEPSDGRLWARLERELSAYCADLFRRGALAGRSSREAFYVRCDAETNAAAARERGEVVAEVGLRPVSTSEFVVVRLFHNAGGVGVGAPLSHA